MRRTCLMLALALGLTGSAPGKKPRVGVTLHPYYSWLANVAGDKAEVVPVIPGGVNPHSYQPRPEDLQTLSGLDAIVVNGIGHDDFIEPMLDAAGKKDILRIRVNEGLPLLLAATLDEPGSDRPAAYNSHSFLSITSSIQQVHTIARGLGKLDPQNAGVYEENARAYARRLRKMLAAALEKINALDASGTRIATVHDGYSYLFAELGLDIAAVVQPRHGIEPSASQLADTIDRIRSAKIDLLFTEMDLQTRYVDAIYAETGCRVLRLSHMSSGGYTPDKFETAMQANLDTVVEGLTLPRAGAPADPR